MRNFFFFLLCRGKRDKADTSVLSQNQKSRIIFFALELELTARAFDKNFWQHCFALFPDNQLLVFLAVVI